MALYVQAQGFFLGFAFTWTLPMPKVVGWPFYLVFDYALGAILSTLIAYLVLEKWQAAAAKKAIVATLLLVLIGASSTAVTAWEYHKLNLHVTEILESQ